jgi:hypothetical protein
MLLSIKYFLGFYFLCGESISLIKHTQGYDVAGVTPEYAEGPEPNTCQICPQGRNGTDVRAIIAFCFLQFFSSDFLRLIFRF